MTISRMLMAAVCALVAGVAVENAKATAECGAPGAIAAACIQKASAAAGSRIN
jgi:hypothetical protein